MKIKFVFCFRMDGFGDSFDQPEVDPAAEFLAREHDQLAGLEDELHPVIATPPVEGIMFAIFIWFCYLAYFHSIMS